MKIIESLIRDYPEYGYSNYNVEIQIQLALRYQVGSEWFSIIITILFKCDGNMKHLQKRCNARRYTEILRNGSGDVITNANSVQT